MTTHAEYLCCACNITMKLNGYAVLDLISCPQCNDPMQMTTAERSYDHHSGFLGESARRTQFSDRDYTPYLKSIPIMPEIISKYDVTELIGTILADKYAEINRTVNSARTAVHKIEAKCADAIAPHEKLCEEIAAIDKTATQARLTAESLRQSVIDQQDMVNRAKVEINTLTTNRRLDAEAAVKQHGVIAKIAAKIDGLSQQQESLSGSITKLDSRIITTADALEAAKNTLTHTAETVKRLDMSYVEEDSKVDTGPAAAAAAPAPTTPKFIDVAKTVGGALAEGAVLGGTAQFISEVADMAVSKALKSGMITPALAESVMFKEGLKFLLPMVMLAAAQYPSCPKQEFFGKVGEIALRGQTAQHAAMAMAFAMDFIGGMVALPSAGKLEDQLSAAQ